MQKREFIRHPTSIPIDYQIGLGMEHYKNPLKDIAFGGLSIQTEQIIPQNHEIILNFTQFKPVFSINGRVAWCKPVEGKYDVGVEFIELDEAFRARMVEQVCYIEAYRIKQEKKLGCKMTSEQAAKEWIAKNSANFPSIDEI